MPESIPRLAFRFPTPDALPFEIGRLERMPPAARTLEPHRHAFFELVWIMQGAGEHDIDFRTYPIVPNAVFFLSPGQVQAMRLRGAVEGFVLLFTADFFGADPSGQQFLRASPLFLPRLHTATIVVSDADAAAPMRTLLDLEREYAVPLPDRVQMLRAHLQVLLITLARLVSPGGSAGNRSPALLREFDALVEAEHGRKMSLGAFAAHLAVTPGHLNAVVRQATGATAGAFVRERNVLEAKRLLLHSDLSVAEIAHQLGFDDPSYFGRYFRRYTSVSPGGFRISSREKYQSGRENALTDPT